MVYTFACKQPGCPLDVTWDNELVPMARPREELGSGRRIYLTCSDGHTHAYEVGTDE